ncbi:twin-arginine translocase subunit TatC [uncultured Thermanaerothrix sp.]|uniref:twin-arginine translocase subunit TatC n=1 Tax=uncultured Thermanaerothrix sp. TaxID=1195149 RepID=UPI00261B4346|nr:twin-arginine translocase subunit TatC [uncultured Thermanaerothrix sp.]
MTPQPHTRPLAEETAQAPATMSLWEHLEELRGRLLKGLIALGLTTSISFAFGERLIAILARPIGGVDKLVSIEVTENIGVFMRVSLLAGFILALPYILYQVVAFVVPGLTPRERRGLFIAIPAASALFIIGVLFAYFVMLPAALPFLISFIGIRTTPRLANYYAFVTNLLFWIGVAFETPLVVFVLAKLRLVSPGVLARQWRLAVIVIAVLAAIITPTPDPVNMTLLMLPLLALYGLSVLLAFVAVR